MKLTVTHVTKFTINLVNNGQRTTVTVRENADVPLNVTITVETPSDCVYLISFLG